jgi:chromosome partitioning protein
LLIGSIFIKSGKVVQAANGSLRGKRAFLNLIRRPPGRFRVFRISIPALIPEPVGSLSSLLIEGLESESGSSQAPRPQSQSQAPQPSQPPKIVPPPPRAATPSMPPRAPQPRKRSGVHQSGATRRPCVIAIASPKGGSGKTTVALNLALSLARREHRVILVDGDVNGDVMSSLDGRTTAKAGVFDVLNGDASPTEALRRTIVQDLEILPALGQSLPSPEIAFIDYRDRWELLLQELAQRAQIVLVDTPAGMMGSTYQILCACSHVLGVLQAEVLAQRSFTMFADCLELIPEHSRPKVLGVFLNMLQLRHNVSIDVLRGACEMLPEGWLFETSVPRNPAFLDATAAGVPLHLYDPKHPPAVSWLFDTLASEVVERLKLTPNDAQQKQTRFLA